MVLSRVEFSLCVDIRTYCVIARIADCSRSFDSQTICYHSPGYLSGISRIGVRLVEELFKIGVISLILIEPKSLCVVKSWHSDWDNIQPRILKVLEEVFTEPTNQD